MSFVYILKNKEGGFYIGSTSNLERRMKQHTKGYTNTTRKMKAFDLVFSQEYKSLEDAKRIEYKLKRLKRHDYIARIVKEGFIKMKLDDMRG
jgi:putative endonuclease